MIQVTIYNEYRHEQSDESVRAVYPQGIHGQLKAALSDDEICVRTYTLETVNEITEQVLKETDVLIWWGHMAHGSVPDEVAARVQKAVLLGMGAIFLHSGHHSKPFRRLMGTSCDVNWREDGDRELVWVCNPAHPIAQGIDRFIKFDHEETYSEPFDIPKPDEVVFIGNYSGGEVFRSGCCWQRGNGRIFYFQPGHESFPIYYDEQVIRVIRNAVYWAKPTYRIDEKPDSHVKKPLED